MRDAENISDVAALGIDYMGFIFYPPSPRYCGESLKRGILESLPSRIEPVAVVVDADDTIINDLADRYGFHTFQLHGNETSQMCERLKERGFTVLKAFGIKDKDDFGKAAQYEGCVDYFLFDTATSSKGGSGKKFDWDILANYNLSTPFFLSGGIGPEDAERIREFHHPCFAGIDLNSRFEIAPARKDVGKLKDFIEEIIK